MYYISTHYSKTLLSHCVHCCAFHHPYLFTYYRYTKYLYPYEYEMKRLSTPSELRAAIDGNKHSSLGYVLTYIESPKEKDQGIISIKRANNYLDLDFFFFYENTIYSGSPIEGNSGSIPLDF